MNIYDHYITPDEYDIALSNGIKKETLEQRVRRLNWSKQKAITTPVQKDSRKHPSWVYDNLEKYGISQPTFYKRVHDLGWSLEEASTTLPLSKGAYRGGKERVYPDWVFDNLKENGVQYLTFWKRFNWYKWDMVKASTTPHQRKGDSIEL